MSDLVKTILKWILVILLTIVVILLVINITNRNSKKKAKSQPVQAIEPIKLEDTENIPVSDDTENTLMVNLGDTASNKGMTFWIGLFLLGTTFYYVSKNRQVNE